MADYQDSTIPDSNLSEEQKALRDAAKSDSSGALPDVTAARPTGVAATDTADLLAAVGDTPAGGFLLIPGDKSDKATPYLLNAPLVIDKHIRIEGASLFGTYAANTGPQDTPVSPGVTGAVLQQVTAATDVLQLSGSGISVQMRNLGLTFASAILNTNTGHGLNAFPSATYSGGGHYSGLTGFALENIFVYGHDGNHYGFQMQNFLLGYGKHLYTFGGGGFLFSCDSYLGNYGNAVFEDLYVRLANAGTANGYEFQARTKLSQGALNLVTFVRPQCNLEGAALTQATQYLWHASGGAATPIHTDVLDPDLEGGTGALIDFGGVNSGTVVRAKGGTLPTPSGGFDTETGYQAFTGNGTYTFIVPNGVFKLRVRAVGAGGGGGGGATNAAAAANGGGSGGAAAMVTEGYVSTGPSTSFTVTIGQGGAGGTGGAAGGNNGGAPGNGGQSSFGSAVLAHGGSGGHGGNASSTSAVGGGIYAGSGQTTTQYIPGCGAPTQNGNGIAAIPIPPGVVGGGAGGVSTTTLGGGGGGAFTASFPAYTTTSGGVAGASATADGVNGTTATTPGCGGGGGGGAPSGGKGGDGGAGADGMVEVWW